MAVRYRIIPLIESAAGIEAAVSIAKSRGASRLAFGSGDYRRDTGTAATGLAMAYPSSRLVIASRVGELPGPIDGPTTSQNMAELRNHSDAAASLGLTGRLCLGASQVEVVNEAMSPSRSDIDWARSFLNDFDARRLVIRDGSDLPRLKQAEKIQSLAYAFAGA